MCFIVYDTFDPLGAFYCVAYVIYSCPGSSVSPLPASVRFALHALVCTGVNSREARIPRKKTHCNAGVCRSSHRALRAALKFHVCHHPCHPPRHDEAKTHRAAHDSMPDFRGHPRGRLLRSDSFHMRHVVPRASSTPPQPSTSLLSAQIAAPSHHALLSQRQSCAASCCES